MIQLIFSRELTKIRLFAYAAPSAARIPLKILKCIIQILPCRKQHHFFRHCCLPLRVRAMNLYSAPYFAVTQHFRYCQNYDVIVRWFDMIQRRPSAYYTLNVRCRCNNLKWIYILNTMHCLDIQHYSSLFFYFFLFPYFPYVQLQQYL